MAETETPHGKFRRLGQDRVNKALAALADVADLATPEFDYTEEECQLMLDVLFDAVHGMKRALQSKLVRKQRFRF